MPNIHRHALLALALAAFLPGHAIAQSKFFTFEQRTDRAGSDYSNTPSRSAADCSNACQLANQCRAWTFVKAGVQGTSARCYLKNAVPAARRDDCCTSGARKAGTVKDSRPTKFD